MTHNRYLVLLQPLLWVQLLFIDLSFARFTYVNDTDNPYITTQVQPNEGLGQIVRDLGLNPNWRNKTWIDQIQEANSKLINSGHLILAPNQTIKIPLSALQDLGNYKKLLSKFEATKTKVSSNHKEFENLQKRELAQSAPTVQTPETPIKQETLQLENNNSWDPNAYFDFSLGSGYYSLNAKSNLQVDTQLSTAASFFANLAFGFDITKNQKLNFNLIPYYSDYNEPNNTTLLQENKWLYNLNASYGLRVGHSTYLSLLWQSHTQQFVRFNFTNLEILAPWIHGAGIELAGELAHFSSSDIWYYFTPKYLLPSNEDLKIDSGYEVSLRLQLQPHKYDKGYLIGASYTFHSQKYPTVDQDTHAILGYIGYRL